jgi:branched-chain amino acid transport system ATP-binding protein
MAGPNPMETQDTCDLVKRIRNTGVTILLVEHIVKAVHCLSDRVIVLNMGQKIAEDIPDKIIHNPQVIDVYLGKAHA